MDVLLVDDHSELRSATRELLETLGHRVTEAASGEEALERSPESFALLVTDLTMPGIDGVELADQMLRREPDLGVLVASTATENPRLRARVDRGDVAFLAKPFSAGELEATISAALAAAKSRDETAPSSADRRRSGSVTEPAPAGTRRSGPPLRTLAVAALTALAAAVAVLVLEPGPPELPVPPPASTVRGTEVELLEPVGPIAELPPAFRWRPVDGSGVYRLTVRAVDDTVLWQDDVEGSRLELPPELAERLLPAVAYTWAVTAFDEAGGRLAWSARTRFRVLPRGENATVTDPR